MSKRDEQRETDDEQRETDLATVRAYLRRGRDPLSGKQMWGGPEWAISRLLDMPPRTEEDDRDEGIA